MTTVRDLLTDALEEIGVLGAGEAINAEDAASCLKALNRLVSTWANEALMIYTVDRQTFNLIGGTQSYTIGVGGTFNTTYPVRPGQIDLASVVVNGVELPIDIINDEQWRDVAVKTTSSTFPLQMWANGNYPLNTLYFWPIPTASNQIILSTWGQITAFGSVNASVSLPQGYEDLIVSALAAKVAPKYGKEASPTTIAFARGAKAAIKAMNWEPTFRTVDTALMGVNGGIGQRSRGYVID